MNRDPILNSLNPYILQIDDTDNIYGIIKNLNNILDDKYIIDIHGNVYQCTKETQELILVPQQIDKRGYRRVTLYNNSTQKSKSITVHRIMKHVFFLCDDPNIFINHKDLNKLNNEISNLELTTCLENTHHAIINNAMSQQASCITDDLITEIRDDVVNNPFKISIVSISKTYKLPIVTVMRIIYGTKSGRYSKLSDISKYLWLPHNLTYDQVQDEIYKFLNDTDTLTNKMKKYVFKYDIMKRIESEFKMNNTTTKVYGRMFNLIPHK